MYTKLACTLRWLAGGSYSDICFAFGIGSGSFFNEEGVLWVTMKLIDDAFHISFPFHSDKDLRKMADEFSSFSHGYFKDCVLAIDRWGQFVEVEVT
jgi:hypothetical protein